MVTCFTHGTALDGEKGRELDAQDRWSEMPGEERESNSVQNLSFRAFRIHELAYGL